MDAPPAIAKLYSSSESNHVNQTPSYMNQQYVYDSNNNNNNVILPPRRIPSSNAEVINTTLHDVVSHSLQPIIDQLRAEIKDLRSKLARATEEKHYAVGQAKVDTYVHVVRVLKQEGVPGVERLKTQYGGDAVAATLRSGGGMMFVGGGGIEAGEQSRKNIVHIAAPSVNADSLTREELHSGLRKALRNL
jgi:hypothetical protein